MLARLCLKSFKLGFSSTWSMNFQDVLTRFWRGRGIRVQISNICWIMGKTKKFQKNIYFCFIGFSQTFDCVDHKICGKFLKRWECQSIFPENYWTIFHNLILSSSSEKLQVTKLGKEYVKAVYCHLAYLTYMQSMSWEMQGWIWITGWNQDCWEEYQQPQICRWYHFSDRKWRETKEPLDEAERGEWKNWLKNKHSKN